MLPELMMDDFLLSLTALVERAEPLAWRCPAVSRRPGGSLDRTTIGESARRARRHLADALAVPGRIEFIGTIPRTATGKFNKTELREQFCSGSRAARRIRSRKNPDLPGVEWA